MRPGVDRIGFSRLRHDRLTDVNDFRCTCAKTVNSKYLQCLSMEQDFEHPNALTNNLGPGQALEICDAYFVRHFFTGKCFLCLANAADFGARVNS